MGLHEKFMALIAQRKREFLLLSPCAQKHLARARLINDGIYYRSADGQIKLHPNYGGDPIENRD